MEYMMYTKFCLVITHQISEVGEEGREIGDIYRSGARSVAIRENRAHPAKTHMIMRPEKYESEATALSI